MFSHWWMKCYRFLEVPALQVGVVEDRKRQILSWRSLLVWPVSFHISQTLLVLTSMPQKVHVEVRAHVFQSDWQISINDVRFIIRSLQAASYHRILHVRPRKKGAEEHYQKIPFVPIFDRIQNVGTLGIHAKHTQHSPPGPSRARRSKWR